MTTPVAYFVFNRPEITATTFEAIRQQQPGQLFIIADGPRPDVPSDVQRCADVRAVVSQVDWPCDVRHNWADTNMGCRSRVSSGIDWVFENVETAIILEDDCLPHPDFFRFCDELLERYATDERVTVITGDNFQNGTVRGDGSYYFSKYNHVWGWATWRRAWEAYDVEMRYWQEWRASEDWVSLHDDEAEREFWRKAFDRTSRGDINTWDYQWTAAVWLKGGLTATPNANLVSNIGHGPDATHTTQSSASAALSVESLGLIIHPSGVERNRSADDYVFAHHFGGAARQNRWHPRNVARAVGQRLTGAVNRATGSGFPP